MNTAKLPTEADGEPMLYEARLSPHRSLNRTGFIVVMALIGGVSFVCGMAFLLMGAWPIFGLFGLDVLAMYIAFRMNFRSARACEEITVTPSLLRVRKVAPDGATRDTEMNPQWTRLETERHEEFGLQHVGLLSRGVLTEVGSFLHPEAREDLARGLSHALADAKRGIARSAP